MPGFTALCKEKLGLPATPIHSASHNGTTNTGTIDMSLFHRAMFLGDVGTLGASATLDASLFQSDNSNGTGATNIASSSIAQISAANSTWTQEINATQLTKRYVLCSTVNAIAASVYGVYAIGVDPRNAPANTNDVSDVVQRFAQAT